MFLFAQQYTFPTFQGIEGGIIPVFVIAYHAPDQTIICRIDQVVIIDSDRGQRRNEYLEKGFRRQQPGELGIQPMNTFDDDHIVPGDF